MRIGPLTCADAMAAERAEGYASGTVASEGHLRVACAREAVQRERAELAEGARAKRLAAPPDDGLPSAVEFHEQAVRLAMEAWDRTTRRDMATVWFGPGSSYVIRKARDLYEASVRERLAQVSQVYAVALDAARAGR